jgi:hypothetical protein
LVIIFAVPGGEGMSEMRSLKPILIEEDIIRLNCRAKGWFRKDRSSSGQSAQRRRNGLQFAVFRSLSQVPEFEVEILAWPLENREAEKRFVEINVQTLRNAP